MPYTKQELENVDFYQGFVNRLRNKYLREMKSLAKVNFRKDDVLYSFEDIFTGLGIETVDVSHNTSYDFLHELDFSMYTAEEMNAAKADPDINLQPKVIDKRKQQYTNITSKQKRYLKTGNLEKIIDRSISELTESRFAETLPEGFMNGDVVTNNISTDYRKWQIENNQKRIFPDNATFCGTGGKYTDLKTLTTTQLNNIPDGEPVD